jgi:hypothetical protein
MAPPRAFADLARSPYATSVDLLAALAGEFAPVDAGAVHSQLDNDARALFGLATLDPSPATRAQRVRDVMHDTLGYRSDARDDPRGVLLPSVLQRRRGHPLAIAAVAAALVERAGDHAIVCSSPRHWLVAIGDPGEMSVLDATFAPPPPSAPPQLRAHCAHQLAYGSLTALATCFATMRRHDEAQRASRLRLTLPLDGVLRATVQAQIDAYDENRRS